MFIALTTTNNDKVRINSAFIVMYQTFKGVTTLDLENEHLYILEPAEMIDKMLSEIHVIRGQEEG